MTSSVKPYRKLAPGDSDWQAALADAVTDAAELCRLLELPAELASAALEAARDFPLRVPRTYLARIHPGQPNDPLLAQILPRREELTVAPDFAADPLGEAQAACATGLLRKYRRRLLILASGACAVHCRFCFRRHLSVPQRGQKGLGDAVLATIAADDSLDEVIFSGGDPLTIPDRELATLVRRLAEIPHLKRIRIHSRLPVLLPQRVTDGLLAGLRGSRLMPILVIHVNHPAELTADVQRALGRVVEAGIPVLQQAVLLRGVNDDVEVLAELYGRLVDLRVMPYYLHQLDRVAGAAHFEVPPARGVELIAQLRARLPGYAVPRYVRETPRAPNKEVLA